MNKIRVLAIDDERGPLDAIKFCIDEEKIELVCHRDPYQALSNIAREAFDVVISDMNLGEDIEASQMFRKAKLKNPSVILALMTGDSGAIRFRKLFDSVNLFFIPKPIEESKLAPIFQRAQMMMDRKVVDNEQPNELFKNLIAESPRMKELLSEIKSYSKDLDLSLHFSGPTGTGKSTFASIVHQLSGNRGPFVTITCSAIPPELASSELFGHVKGAFTGAIADKEGAISHANGGTLFLDELHLLPKDVQGKLLRVLNDGTYTRVGDIKEQKSKFRLITAASLDLKKLIEEGKFIEDLYFRVCKKTLRVPKLSERRACIPKLVYSVLKRREEKLGKKFEIDAEAMDALMGFSWDGNIRDLQNSIETISARLEDRGVVTASLVRDDLSHRRGHFDGVSPILNTGENLSDAVARFEKELISNALQKTNGMVKNAADVLGIPRGTLRSKIEKYAIRARG